MSGGPGHLVRRFFGVLGAHTARKRGFSLNDVHFLQGIANLLANPKVTEALVLKICARRPTVSPPLEAVLRSPRWRDRYAVRLRW